MALVAPNIITSVRAAGGIRPPPSGRVVVGVIGWGMQGPPNTGNLMNLADCQVVAACDLHQGRRERAVNEINRHYGNTDCKAYTDYREMMARPDIDAVMIAVPDHWHALMAIEAAKNGKDIYGEKPLARTIAEQQAIVKAVQANQRIWQTGSWQRSDRNFHYAAEIVRNGLIGKVTRVEVGLPSGHNDFPGTGRTLLAKLRQLPNPPRSLAEVVPGTPAWEASVSEAPADYDTWLGPSRMEPYIEARIYQNWRWNYNTGGGQLMDWIGHHCDIAHWGLGDDDKIGPSEVEGEGEFPPPNAIWNTCTRYRITAKYPNEVTMIIAGGHRDISQGTKWIGTEGWVWVNRGGFDCSIAELQNSWSLPEEKRKVKLINTASRSGHQRNFIDSVKSRQPTVAPVEVAHHSAIPGHLGLIAMLVKRKIKWDAAKEEITGDAEASKLLSRPYREPWKLG